MLNTLGILTDHVATSQSSYRKEPSDWCLYESKEHKEEQDSNWLKTCYLLHIIHPQSILWIFLITFFNSDTDLLDLTKLGNLFQIKDPRKFTELVPQIVDHVSGMKSAGPCLRLCEASVFEGMTT